MASIHLFSPILVMSKGIRESFRILKILIMRLPRSCLPRRITAWDQAATGPPEAPSSLISKWSSPRASRVFTVANQWGWGSCSSASRTARTSSPLVWTAPRSSRSIWRRIWSLRPSHVQRDGAGREPILLPVTCRSVPSVEVDYFRNGGILHTVLCKIAGIG